MDRRADGRPLPLERRGPLAGTRLSLRSLKLHVKKDGTLAGLKFG